MLPPTCPLCNGPMTIRCNRRMEDYWVCQDAPECPGIIKEDSRRYEGYEEEDDDE